MAWVEVGGHVFDDDEVILVGPLRVGPHRTDPGEPSGTIRPYLVTVVVRGGVSFELEGSEAHDFRDAFVAKVSPRRLAGRDPGPRA